MINDTARCGWGCAKSASQLSQARVQRDQGQDDEDAITYVVGRTAHRWDVRFELI
jgi:hypothetical protein